MSRHRQEEIWQRPIEKLLCGQQTGSYHISLSQDLPSGDQVSQDEEEGEEERSESGTYSFTHNRLLFCGLHWLLVLSYIVWFERNRLCSLLCNYIVDFISEANSDATETSDSSDIVIPSKQMRQVKSNV